MFQQNTANLPLENRDIPVKIWQLSIYGKLMNGENFQKSIAKLGQMTKQAL
jgi:hypothetical protein